MFCSIYEINDVPEFLCRSVSSGIQGGGGKIGEKSLYKKVVIQQSGATQWGNTYPSCICGPRVPRLIDLNVNGCLSFMHTDSDIDASEVYPGESITNHFEGIRVGLLRSLHSSFLRTSVLMYFAVMRDEAKEEENWDS